MTTKLEQAARQALKALIDSDDGGGLRYTEVQAVAALREALTEQAEQEPVAFTNKEQLGYLKDPRYQTTPMAMWATPFNESVNIPLYAAPVRTKDLTDDEIYIAVGSAGFGASLIAGCRAVIAADREKNRG